MLYKHLFSILCGHLNLNKKKIEFGRLPVKPAGKPVRTVCTADFEFKFDLDRYRPVSGQTGPVYRYRTRPDWPDRSVRETLITGMEFCVGVLDHMYSFVTILARQAMMWYHSVLTPYPHTCLCPVHTIEKIGEPKLSMCGKHIVPLNAHACVYVLCTNHRSVHHRKDWRA